MLLNLRTRVVELQTEMDQLKEENAALKAKLKKTDFILENKRKLLQTINESELQPLKLKLKLPNWNG